MLQADQKLLIALQLRTERWEVAYKILLSIWRLLIPLYFFVLRDSIDAKDETHFFITEASYPGVDRMARDMNQELSKLGIICLSVYPGVVRTERMKEVLDSGTWRDRTGLDLPPEFIESPKLTGQVIATLFHKGSEDGFLDQMAGKVCVTAEVAKRYDIKDPISNYLSSAEKTKWKWLESLLISLSPDILLPMSLMAQGAPEQQTT
eukprot:gene21114-21901_t